MKDFYNAYIYRIVNELIAEKDTIVEEINTIASTFEYHGEIPKKLDLKQEEINKINSQRNNMGAIYQLIGDLEKLKK